MLSEQEVNKIFSWLPYRDDWPVDRNQKDDKITLHYGKMIDSFIKNPLFETYYSEQGGLSNYLEFLCYPKGNSAYTGNAVLVCVSLCAPIAAYGQTTLQKGNDYISCGYLFNPDKIYIITDPSLTNIENEIKSILQQQILLLPDKEFVSRQLPNEIIEDLKGENHNEGNQYLHGIFQRID